MNNKSQNESIWKKLRKELTFAIGIGGSSLFNLVAAFSYSGASFLQCPHLKNK